MKLFTVGPVEMYPSIIGSSSYQIPYFRTDDFSSLMFENERLFKHLTKATDNSRVVFLTCSGTGAMEAAIDNCFDKRDSLLIVNGGSFGERFCEICDCHGINYQSIDLNANEILTEHHLNQFEGQSFNGLVVNANETSTGQLYDLEMLSSFCKRNGLLFVVDAISSFLADNINCSSLGIDILITSSQKALALDPGLSILLLSEKACAKCKNIQPSCYYFDIKRHLKDMERGQTPFTPAVGILIQLNQMLHLIEKESIESKINRTKQLADYFRMRIKSLPVTIPSYPLSNAVTPIIFKSGAMNIFRRLKEEYEMMVTPSGGYNKDKMLRISHLGNLNESDYDLLIEALNAILADIDGSC